MPVTLLEAQPTWLPFLQRASYWTTAKKKKQ